MPLLKCPMLTIMQMWNSFLVKLTIQGMRMVSSHQPDFTPRAVLQTWDVPYLFVTVETKPSDWSPTHNHFENCHHSYIHTLRCLTLTTTEEPQDSLFPQSVIDRWVEFLMLWGYQTRERTGRTSTQGPDQVLPYATDCCLDRAISGQRAKMAA